MSADSGSAIRIVVDIVWHVRAPSLRRRGVKEVVRNMLKHLGTGPASVAILVTSDVEIRSLNARYRGVDAPTDVLSFPSGDCVPGSGGLLGDIVISMDMVALQAQEKAWTVQEEVAFLLLHGILHLLGFDHAEEAEARVMEARSLEIWRAIHPSVSGIGSAGAML